MRKREAGTKAPLEGTVMKKKYDETNIETCPLVDVQKIIQSKWAIIVMYYLQGETLRLGELSRKTPQVTQANLTKVLRTLEEAGLVHREVYPVVPPKVEYSLTPIGQQFKIVLEALEVWSTKYVEFKKEEARA